VEIEPGGCGAYRGIRVDEPSERASGDNCGQIRRSGGSNHNSMAGPIMRLGSIR
jgi:hypothetical protein